MDKRIVIVMVCMVIVCSGCSKNVNGRSGESTKERQSEINQINNDVFTDLENINIIHAHSCVGEGTDIKDKKEIANVVLLLQSISLEDVDGQEGADEQLSADGQMNFQLNEDDEEIMDVILSSRAMRINGKWYLTEDEDILFEIQDNLS